METTELYQSVIKKREQKVNPDLKQKKWETLLISFECHLKTQVSYLAMYFHWTQP